MSFWVAIAVVAGSLVTLARIGLARRDLLGALILTQVGYWAVGLVARPLFLVLVAPDPRFEDPLSDGRLAFYGYQIGLGEVLTPVSVGIAFYAAVVWLWTRRRVDADRRRRERRTLRLGNLVALLAAGWVLRMYAQSAPASNLADTLASIGSIAVGAIVLFTVKRPSASTLVLLGISELAWSVLTASKTPVLALALWLVIRFISDGAPVPKRTLTAIGIAGLGAFYAIQNVKVSEGRLTEVDEYSYAYPPLARPILPLLARFDAVQSNTDAWAAGPAVWRSPGEAISSFFYSLLPQFALTSPKEFAGVLWGTEVRPLSSPGVAGANLAEGPFAEGWVLAGWTGVFVETFLLALVVFFTAWLLTRNHLYGMFLGLAMTSQPLIFERGMLGIGEGIGKGLQVTLVASIAMFILELRAGPATTRLSARRGTRAAPLPVPS